MLPRPPDLRVRLPLHGQPLPLAAVVDAGGAGRALLRVDPRLHRHPRPPPRRREHQVEAEAADTGGMIKGSRDLGLERKGNEVDSWSSVYPMFIIIITSSS